jgi:hypothetical protein
MKLEPYQTRASMAAMVASAVSYFNRQLTLSYGSTGTQNVGDTVLNWRNVAPCGN